MKKRMPWLRLYTEVLDDPKVQRLPAEEFRSELYKAASGHDSAFAASVRPFSGRPDPKEWSDTRARIFRRDDYTCGYCGVRGARLHCDHMIPLALGGSNEDDNLIAACAPCNRRKNAKTATAFRALLVGAARFVRNSGRAS